MAHDDPIGRVEALLGELESLPDPAARSTAMQALQALLALYGEGLERVLERSGPVQARALAEDELIGHLLLLHGLHPVDVETRVRTALAGVRPYLESHGGNVELLGVHDGVARLRMQGSCSGCPASAMTLKLAIEDAIQKAAPDIDRVEAEGVDEQETPPPGALPMAGSNGAPAADGLPMAYHEPGADGTWATAGGLPQLVAGGTLLKEIAGQPVLFAALDGDRYAYRPTCPGCEASLEEAALEGGELVCAGCGHRYDVRRAGRCLDAPQLYLQPVPLLTGDSGIVKVALA